MRATVYDNTGEIPRSYVINIQRWGFQGAPTPSDAKEEHAMEEWFESSLCADCEDLEESCRMKRIAPCAAVIVHRQRAAKRMRQELDSVGLQVIGDSKDSTNA